MSLVWPEQENSPISHDLQGYPVCVSKQNNCRGYDIKAFPPMTPLLARVPPVLSLSGQATINDTVASKRHPFDRDNTLSLSRTQHPPLQP